MKTVALNVERWSGKDRGDENFPVGSALIAARWRRHVHAFYTFARNADDIADSAILDPADKLARLEVMEEVLTGLCSEGSPSALALRASLAETGVSDWHARELLVAFRRDATCHRYASWAELYDYCRYSAMPVGRYVLDLHGESRETYEPSDALCTALQVLNHLQDCQTDLLRLDRCYLPQEWLAKALAAVEDCAHGETRAPLRTVFDRLLDKADALNRAAVELPRRVRARGLRVETAVIVNLSWRLAARLRREDPLARKVKLRPLDVLGAVLAAARFLP